MRFLNTDTLEQAREKLLKAADLLETKTETIPLTSSCARILAQPLRASFCVPDFRRSTVDGYALRAKDTQGAGESIPTFLQCVGEVRMGAPAERRLAPGQCMYVPTGGMIPEGADAMVMVEYTEGVSDTEIAVYQAVSPGSNVIQIGEDVKEGQLVLPRGRRLSAADVGVIASCGLDRVQVFVMPQVTILSTGDELVQPGEPKAPGRVYDINTYGVMAQCANWGMTVREQRTLPDDRTLIREAVSRAMQDSDLVILSGGSSKGRADYTAELLDELSEPGVSTHGIRLKPGKPTILGADEDSRTLLVGLPGHPAAAMMVFDLLILWMLRRKLAIPEPRCLRAKMQVNVSGGNGRAVCQMVQLVDPEESGELYTARPLLGASGLIGVLSRADGYVMIGADKEGIKKGETVEVIPL